MPETGVDPHLNSPFHSKPHRDPFSILTFTMDQKYIVSMTDKPFKTRLEQPNVVKILPNDALLNVENNKCLHMRQKVIGLVPHSISFYTLYRCCVCIHAFKREFCGVPHNRD